MTDFADRRILVVDDEPANRRLIKAILAPEGGTLLQAADGLAALEMIEHDDIDLVLVDVMMPGIDGIEVCRRIRARTGDGFLPVILVTALADPDSRARGKEAGADDFLTKPVHEDELLARCRNLLRLRSYHELARRQARMAEREAQRWRLTSEIAGAVAVSRDYPSVLGQISTALASHVPVDHACILDVDQQHLVVCATWPCRVEDPTRLWLEWGMQSWIDRFADTGVVRVIAGESRTAPISMRLQTAGFAEGVAIPVFGAGSLHSVFVLARHGAFSDDDLEIVRNLAPHLGNALNNVRLHTCAEELLRGREQLTQFIVHDFRNQLGAVLANVELASDPGLSDAERAPLLEDAHGATQRVVSLVTDLMNSSAAEDGRLQLDCTILDLRELMRQVVAGFAPLRKLRVVMEGDHAAPANVDRGLMSRVVENILSNAARYVPEDGTITISVERDGESAIIAIANNGPPLDPAIRSRLFQKYIGESTTRRHTSGIGLFFCRTVIEAQRGSIRETQPPHGTRFEIRLPLASSRGR